MRRRGTGAASLASVLPQYHKRERFRYLREEPQRMRCANKKTPGLAPRGLSITRGSVPYCSAAPVEPPNQLGPDRLREFLAVDARRILRAGRDKQVGDVLT